MEAASVNYSSVLVEKPWGFEYLMFRNSQVGLWFLHLKSGASTSMHCHPRKKTGLVVLSGNAELKFLNDSTQLKPLSKVMIRAGLFHSTSSTSPAGTALLEIESPFEKENLVRLEDAYGRKSKPYEGEEATKPLPEQFLRLNDPVGESPVDYPCEGCVLTMLKTTNASRIDLSDPHTVFVVLDGGLLSPSKDLILSPGDVVATNTMAKLLENFSVSEGISLLTINRP